jgi:NTE family protein
VTNALVLAGGGVAGVAWELGVLQGIADADPALAARIVGAELIVGTSAGASVAAQLTSGMALADLYARQLRTESGELDVDVDMPDLLRRWAEAAGGGRGLPEVRRRIGAMALAADTVDEATRRAVIASRLAGARWPARRVVLTAVDADTGEPATFTRDSGVDLVDAVAASCAVPGVWPVVTIGGRRYMDGGVRSITNADLAAGSDRVLVVQPALADAPRPFGSLRDELVRLAPARVYVVSADQASVEAFGSNPLSPATREPSARAGRSVGAAHAAALAAFWP